ncbi:MAG: HupE/UreJ family protein [Pseudonocardiaceae bacterium]
MAVNATAVDVVIALSVVFVGVVGVLGRPQRWWWFTTAVFAFGLVHGLGLSTRLQDLRLPENGLVARVITFNVGIEIGQLLAVVVMVALGKLFTRLITWPKAPRLAYGGLVAVGLVAAVVLAVATPSSADQVEAFGSCTVRPNTQNYSGEGDHPGKDFFEPGEETPEADFGHLIGDGYVIVHYSPALPAPQLAQLREFITGPEGHRVVGGAVTGQADMLNASNADKTITCQDVDLIALKNFTKAWFADPRSR